MKVVHRAKRMNDAPIWKALVLSGLAFIVLFVILLSIGLIRYYGEKYNW